MRHETRDTRHETHTLDNNTERRFFFTSSDIRLATLIPGQQSLYIHNNSTEWGLLFVRKTYLVFVDTLLWPPGRHDDVYMHFWYVFLFIWRTLAFVPLFGPIFALLVYFCLFWSLRPLCPTVMNVPMTFPPRPSIFGL